jgi:hypothetical protein
VLLFEYTVFAVIFRTNFRRSIYPESIEWFIHKIYRFRVSQAFSRLYDLAPHPPRPPVSKLDPRHTGRLRKRDNLLPGERGGRAAKSYDRKKAWSSINHSILSVFTGLRIFRNLSELIDVVWPEKIQNTVHGVADPRAGPNSTDNRWSDLRPKYTTSWMSTYTLISKYSSKWPSAEAKCLVPDWGI